MTNVDPSQIAHFDHLADRFWAEEGEFSALHRMNPVRLAWIESISPLAGQSVLDVGCGGGILSEALAKKGAQVTGIDLSEKAILAAQNHLLASAVSVNYEAISVEDLAARAPASFDLVTCMELLEHVPDPKSILNACHRLLKPNGMLFLSTINRTLKAAALLIGGAEYVLNMIPKGTHQFSRFIKPSELLRNLRETGFAETSLTGLSYDPFRKKAALSEETSINYLLSAKRI